MSAKCVETLTAVSKDLCKQHNILWAPKTLYASDIPHIMDSVQPNTDKMKKPLSHTIKKHTCTVKTLTNFDP
jgi:hypothetical protein